MHSVRPMYWNICRTISSRRGQESRQKRFCYIRTTFEPTCWWWWWRQSVTAGSSSFHICHTHRAWPTLTLNSPKHEKHMTGKRYETDDDVIGTVRSHVENLFEMSCWNGITKCFQRNTGRFKKSVTVLNVCHFLIIWPTSFSFSMFGDDVLTFYVVEVPVPRRNGFRTRTKNQNRSILVRI